MKALLTFPKESKTCQPLNCNRNIYECTVGNITLLEALQDRLLKNGVTEFVNKGDLEEGKLFMQVRADCWLSSEAVQKMLIDGKPVYDQGELIAYVVGENTPAELQKGYSDSGSFLIRHPWDILKINEEIVSALKESIIHGEVSPAVHTEGKIIVGEGSRLLPGVFIEGNIIIGRNCKIGPNCYLRGSTSIGDNCHIGQAVEIKNSILMNGSSVGHLSYVGDSVLGENVNFGAGTITANLRHDGTNHKSKIGKSLLDTGRRKLGAIIGDDVHTGINTSFYPGRKMWPKTSTIPGQIVNEDII